jgi:hypothetical protein
MERVMGGASILYFLYLFPLEDSASFFKLLEMLKNQWNYWCIVSSLITDVGFFQPRVLRHEEKITWPCGYLRQQVLESEKADENFSPFLGNSKV